MNWFSFRSFNIISDLFGICLVSFFKCVFFSFFSPWPLFVSWITFISLVYFLIYFQDGCVLKFRYLSFCVISTSFNFMHFFLFFSSVAFLHFPAFFLMKGISAIRLFFVFFYFPVVIFNSIFRTFILRQTSYFLNFKLLRFIYLTFSSFAFLCLKVIFLSSFFPNLSSLIIF